MLELGDRPENVEEHPTQGGGGVDPLVEDHQIDPLGLQLTGQGDEVLERAPQTVELRDDRGARA